MERGADMTRRVTLREEHDGPNHRYLRAYLDTEGNLHIDGHDLGPLTATVSNDGEYEWFRTIHAKELPRLLYSLGSQPDEDVLGVLEARYTGVASYELERRIRDADVPSELHVWSG
jgi:hypothetical protein